VTNNKTEIEEVMANDIKNVGWILGRCTYSKNKR